MFKKIQPYIFPLFMLLIVAFFVKEYLEASKPLPADEIAHENNNEIVIEGNDTLSDQVHGGPRPADN